MKRSLAHHIPTLARGWRQLADAALAEFGVSNSAGWCLVHIDRLAPSVRQSSLAESLGISQPSLVRTLDQLQAAGLVTRKPDPHDKRSNRIVLTTGGQDLVGRIEAKLGALRADLLEGVPEDTIERAANLMVLLNRRITERRSAS
jgi:MarR family transcriptional regulator for hemolysin